MADFLKGALIGLAGVGAGLVVLTIALSPVTPGRDMVADGGPFESLTQAEPGTLALLAARIEAEPGDSVQHAAMARLKLQLDGMLVRVHADLANTARAEGAPPRLPQSALDAMLGTEIAPPPGPPGVANLPGMAERTDAAAPNAGRGPDARSLVQTDRLPQIAVARPGGPAAGPQGASRNGAETETGSETETPPESASATASPAPVARMPGTRTAAAVRTARLPQIGRTPAAASDGAEAPRWQTRRAGIAGGELPRIGLILHDTAEDSQTEAMILDLTMPVTVALPPFAPDAPRRALLYAAAGHEVLLSLEAIPALAIASDLEVLVSSWLEDFPDAMGVVDLPSGDARRGRSLAPVLIPVLQDHGLALVAPERGLSPMLSAARQGGVAHLGLYRSLDRTAADAAAVGRILDRVAFEASRQAHMAVIARPDLAETRAALLAWLDGAGSGGPGARVQTLPAGALLIAP